MMSINENNEFKGKITAEGDSLPSAATVTAEGTTFKDEFDKLLDNSGAIDASAFIASPLSSIPSQIDYTVFDSSINETLGVGETYKIDTKKIENADAMFFLNISSAGSDSVNLQINNDTSVIDASNYKTMEVSKTLGDIIMKSAENNKAVRLDFDNNVTVVLKVSREGKIDTTFIPQDKQVEQYLKNNIDYLKVRFDEQNIAYSNISYKPYRQNKNNKQGDKQ